MYACCWRLKRMPLCLHALQELGAARAEAARYRRMSGDSFKRWCAQQARSGAVGLMAQLEPDFLVRGCVS